MLVLTREVGTSVYIFPQGMDGPRMEIKLLRAGKRHASIGFAGTDGMKVLRKELFDRDYGGRDDER